MPQAQSQAPRPEGKIGAKYRRILVVVPEEWIPLMTKRMAEKGCYSYGEYIRDLIREDLEKEKEADQ